MTPDEIRRIGDNEGHTTYTLDFKNFQVQREIAAQLAEIAIELKRLQNKSVFENVFGKAV